MNIVRTDALRHFQGQQPTLQEVEQFVNAHRLCPPPAPSHQLAVQIEEHIKKNGSPGARGRTRLQQQIREESLYQLGLYLNRETNRQIFGLFEHILEHPKGTTYDVLARKVRTDIITVSHYCCKLKKLRLIDWEHEKEGVVVFPRQRRESEAGVVFTAAEAEVSFDVEQSFVFQELGLLENIWLNISSEEAVTQGGLTNEEVKRKVLKHAENKMVRRTVDSMRFFSRDAERQGKVFEFKYKNETAALRLARGAVRPPETELEGDHDKLEPEVLAWLRGQFPEFEGEHFLRDLINNKFKDYLSILGVKQSKRQCTPLKLNRYVRVLNYLHRRGGLRENQLRTLIIRQELNLNSSVGIMHKRSLLGILEGLKNIGIIAEEDEVYFPGWLEPQNWKRPEPRPKEQGEGRPRKKVHADSSARLALSTEPPADQRYRKISKRAYSLQILAAVMEVVLGKALERCLRKAFIRIVYVERKRLVPKYVPQINVLGLIGGEQAPQLRFDCSLDAFYRQIDQAVQERGEVESPIGEVDNEVLKFLRRSPSKQSSFLRIKYGRGWAGRFEQLQRAGLVTLQQDRISLSPGPRLLI